VITFHPLTLCGVVLQADAVQRVPFLLMGLELPVTRCQSFSDPSVIRLISKASVINRYCLTAAMSALQADVVERVPFLLIGLEGYLPGASS
jgi:hypothetical protein